MCQLISLNIIYVYCISMLHQIKEMQDCYFNIWIWMLCKSWTLPLANAFTKLLKSLSQWSLNFVYTDAVHSASKGKDWHTWTSTHTHTSSTLGKVSNVQWCPPPHQEKRGWVMPVLPLASWPCVSWFFQPHDQQPGSPTEMETGGWKGWQQRRF